MKKTELFKEYEDLFEGDKRFQAEIAFRRELIAALREIRRSIAQLRKK